MPGPVKRWICCAKEWQRAAREGITAAELTDAKTYLTGAYPLRFTSTSRIAGILVGIQREGLGMDYIARRNDLINAVTLEDVNRVAARVLGPVAAGDRGGWKTGRAQ